MKYYIIPVSLNMFDSEGFKKYYMTGENQILKNWRESGDKIFDYADGLSYHFDDNAGEWYIEIDTLEMLDDLISASPHGEITITMSTAKIDIPKSLYTRMIYIDCAFGVEDDFMGVSNE